jgi:hypothetical protein
MRTFPLALSVNITILFSAAFMRVRIAVCSLLPTAATTAAAQGLPLLAVSWYCTCRLQDGSLGRHATAQELSVPPSEVKPSGQAKHEQLPLPGEGDLALDDVAEPLPGVRYCTAKDSTVHNGLLDVTCYVTLPGEWTIMYGCHKFNRSAITTCCASSECAKHHVRVHAAATQSHTVGNPMGCLAATN